MWKTQGYDLHLVGLPNGVRIFDLDAFVNLPASVTFRPLVTGMSASVHGISFTVGGPDSKPNRMMVVQWQPAVRSIVVDAVRTNTPTISARIHVHDGLKRAVLTPDELTIRQGSTSGFSLLAEFTDGMAGDITLHPGLQWNVKSGNIAIDSSSGIIAANAATGEAEIEVVLPDTLFSPGALPPPDQRTLAAKVRLDAPWTQELHANFMRGAGPHLWPQARNVLFIPDGFVGDEGRREFERAIYHITYMLQNSQYTHPFGQLMSDKAKGFNFFNLWLPSRQQGGTISNQLRRGRGLVGVRTHPSRAQAAANPNPKISDVSHLLFRVGPPTKADSTRDFGEQKDEWNRLYEPAFIEGLTQEIYDEWKAMYPPIFVLERDTALGIAQGDRPRAQGSQLLNRSPRWNQRRSTRDLLDQLLRRLVTSTRTNPREPIGPSWADAVSPGDTPGKDAEFVYVISRAPIDGGVRTHVDHPQPDGSNFRTDLMICSNLFMGSPRLQTSPDEGAVVDLGPLVLPDVPSRDVWSTISHEMGHSLHLGDEYAEIGPDIPGTEAERARREFWNLTVDAVVMNGSNLIAENTPWFDWPRIRAAGVMADAPTLSANDTKITIRLRAGHGAEFAAIKQGEILGLRRRPLVDADRTTPSRSPAITFVKCVGDQIEGTTVATMRTFVQGLTAQEIAAGLVVFAGQGDKLQDGKLPTLMHLEVATRIRNVGVALNRDPDSLGQPCKLDKTAVQVVRNIPPKLASIGKMSLLVGLYEGGKTFGCHVFHPQGICMMRTQVPIVEGVFSDGPVVGDGRDLVRLDREDVVAPFCPVCRYIIVDQLDPRLHGPMDAEYERQYPVVS